MTSEINREELKQKLEHPKGFILVDVLPAENYRHSHLPGAINMPREQIHAMAPEQLPDKDQEIIVYCAGPECQASEEAARELSEMGYSRVRRYAGGKADWASAKLPLAGNKGKQAA